MRSVSYTAHNSDFHAFPTVSVTERPLPSPARDEVLVRVLAAACNPIDVKVLGGGVWPIKMPFVMGYDFSGVVASVGEDVKNFSPGEEVWAVNWGKANHEEPGRPVAGAFADYLAIPASKLSRKLARVSHKTAAALALVGTTAFQGLFSFIGAKRGDKLLILGGASAVGLIGIQLAKLKGCHVTVTCSPRSLNFVKQFNPDRTIDYTTTKWYETGEYDAVFDTVGETGTFAHAKGCVKKDGAFCSITNFEAGFDPAAHAPLKAAFFCLSNDAVVQNELMGLVENDKLRIPIDTEFPFTEDEVREMLRKQESGKSMGKNILNVA